MKKKLDLEADLDPKGTRHTRPGGKIAERALANSKHARKRSGAASSPTRPGSTAAARAVAATKKRKP
jgi:hypothetical protein